MSSLRLGMLLFIASEAALFLAFFWAYLDAAFTPAIALGATWPPIGVLAINALGLPLLNTLLLLASGATLTYAHHLLLTAASLPQVAL